MAISRREFLKGSALAAAGTFAFGLTKPTIVRALEDAQSSGVKLVWIQGQSCSACTVSLLQGLDPDLYDAIDQLSVRIDFHQTIMQSYGDEAMAVLDAIDPDILVVEGSIPLGIPEACTLGEKDGVGTPFADWVEDLAARTKVAIVGVGSCATYDGIPGAKDGVKVNYRDINNSPTGAVGLYEFFKRSPKPSVPVVLLPGCPMHPDWFLSVAAALLLGIVPEIDDMWRPKVYFSRVIHDHCARRGYYGKGQFATSLLETSPSYEKCLYQVGCKAPFVLAACAETRWNGGANVCMAAGAPCIGCMAPGFPDGMSPFYVSKESTELIFGIDPLMIGIIATGAAVAGAAAHALRRGTKHPEFKED